MATGVKKTRSMRPWYGLWCSDANWDRKNIPVWQTVVWPLGLQKLSLSDWGVANGITKFRMASGGLMSVTIPRSHRSGFFLSLFDIGCQWPYHGPGLWDCGMVIDVQVYNIKKKNGLTDRGMATGLKKKPILWHRGIMAFDIRGQNVLKKTGQTDRGVATGVKKPRTDRPRCGHWSYQIPYGLWRVNRLLLIIEYFPSLSPWVWLIRLVIIST